MSCYSMISIKTPQGRINVPCGVCAYCLQKKRSEWTYRLLQELKISEYGSFWTFTYSNDRLPKNGLVDKVEVQKFIKRLRKENDKFKLRMKYFLCGEYGDKTSRPHYHAIIFNLSPLLYDKVEFIWQNGQVYRGDVTQASIHYTTKYVLKNISEKNTFALMSKNLGISYVKDKQNRNFHLKNKVNYLVTDDGKKVSMPRYYKDRIFSKITIQVLGKEQMDKQLEKQKIAYDKDARKVIKLDKDSRKIKTNRVISQSKSKKV